LHADGDSVAAGDEALQLARNSLALANHFPGNNATPLQREGALCADREPNFHAWPLQRDCASGATNFYADKMSPFSSYT
jgi:hypothetical protein